MPEPKRVGRPHTQPKPDQKATLNVRAAPALKEALLASAAAADRSLSAEMEFRLETSFRAAAPLFHGLDLLVGPEKTAVILLIALVMQEASAREAGDWLRNPEIAAATAAAVVRAIGAILPETADIEPDERRVRRYLRPLQQLRDVVATDAAPQYPLYLLAGELVSRLSPRLRDRLARLSADLSTAADASERGDFIISERPGLGSRSVVIVNKPDPPPE
jgi:hypothetical protein